MAMIKHQKITSVAEMAGLLLERLELAKKLVPVNSELEKFIDQSAARIVEIKNVLDSRERIDRELVGYIEKMARQIYPLINHDTPIDKDDVVSMVQGFKYLLESLGNIASEMGARINQPPYNFPRRPIITEVGESSNTSHEQDEEVSKVQEFEDLLESLGIIESCFVKSLCLFPENIKLKKRLVIYWWYMLLDTEGFERLFSRLIEKKVLIPVHRVHNKAIDSFTIKPIFYKWLISNSDRYGLIGSEKRVEGTWHLLQGNLRNRDFTILLNLDQRYLSSMDIKDISSSKQCLEVVQLGSWHKTKVHNGVEETESELNDHIEVDQTDFLKKLGKDVRFLSLRGISGITELPESIGKQAYLRVLDLRACHNLKKLPKKPRSTLIQKLIRWKFCKESGWFKKLQVLDISECYKLKHMPKWICELSNLVVLKGFVVGALGNKNKSCRLHDLSKLNNLEKLSIRIPNCILGPKDFEGFNSLDSLLVLTITWGQKMYTEIPTYSLPKNLEKLDMRRYPEADASKWQNPEELEKLKRLYIRGGKLTKIPCHNNWKVEILRLRFLNRLETDREELTNSFKNLKYVGYVECPRAKNFPNDGNTWRNEE